MNFKIQTTDRQTAAHHKSKRKIRTSARHDLLVWSLLYYSVSQRKIPPYGFLKFFPKWLGIFNQFFTHLLYDHFYTRVQIFI